MSLDLIVRSATVPSPLDCVVSNPNWQALINLLSVTFPNDLGNFSVGNTEPPPTRRGDPWFRYESDGTPDGWYVYAMGAWLKRHTTAPGTVVMWEGLEADIPTFDGGEAGAVTEISGPMWERVTQMDAKFPIGPGTLPSTTVIGIGDTGGEENHELDTTEIPPHTHECVAVVDQSPGPGGGGTDLGPTNHIPRQSNFDGAGSPFSYHLGGVTNAPTAGLTSTTGGTGSPAAVVGHNTLPPFRAIWFLRKTGRLFFRI